MASYNVAVRKVSFKQVQEICSQRETKLLELNFVITKIFKQPVQSRQAKLDS